MRQHWGQPLEPIAVVAFIYCASLLLFDHPEGRTQWYRQISQIHWKISWGQAKGKRIPTSARDPNLGYPWQWHLKAHVGFPLFLLKQKQRFVVLAASLTVPEGILVLVNLSDQSSAHVSSYDSTSLLEPDAIIFSWLLLMLAGNECGNHQNDQIILCRPWRTLCSPVMGTGWEE